MKRVIYSFIAGFGVGVLIGGIIFAPEKTKSVTDILQTVVIIFATIFTAWWTSMTYGRDHKQKEALVINKMLEELATSASEKYFHENLKEILRNDVINKNNQQFQKMGLEKAMRFSSLKNKIESSLHLYATINSDNRNEIKRLCNVEGKDLHSKELFQEYVNRIVIVQKNITNDAYFDFQKEIKKLLP